MKGVFGWLCRSTKNIMNAKSLALKQQCARVDVFRKSKCYPQAQYRKWVWHLSKMERQENGGQENVYPLVVLRWGKTDMCVLWLVNKWQITSLIQLVQTKMNRHRTKLSVPQTIWLTWSSHILHVAAGRVTAHLHSVNTTTIWVHTSLGGHYELQNRQ